MEFQRKDYRPACVQTPGTWTVPGGRVEGGEAVEEMVQHRLWPCASIVFPNSQIDFLDSPAEFPGDLVGCDHSTLRAMIMANSAAGSEC